MQFMDELIVDMGITDENQPLHKEIVCRAIELWNKNGYGEGMSEQTAKQMATLVRQPEATRARPNEPSHLPRLFRACRMLIADAAKNLSMSLASTIAHAPRGVLDPSIQSILPRIPWPHDGIENCYLQLCQEEVGRISNHPSGLDDVVFLRTALSEIGEALFPLIWSSREMNPASLEISALPDKPNPLGLRLDSAREIPESISPMSLRLALVEPLSSKKQMQ